MKKKMIKIVGLLLTSTLMFTACSSDEGTTTPTPQEQTIPNINLDNTVDEFMSEDTFDDDMSDGFDEDETSSSDLSEDLSEEPTTETGAITNVKKTYADKHPGLYSWYDKEIKYRRWYYLFGEDTEYIGSIINGDGTILEGTGIHNAYDDETVNSGGKPSEGPTNSGSMSSTEYTLTSAYANYKLNSGGVTGVTFDVQNSSSGRLRFTYNGATYFIETVRASQIRNLHDVCIYSTDDMKNNDFEVEISSTMGDLATSKGTITPYTIKYTSKNSNKAVTKPYMAVYNISNDYLVIYSDVMPSDEVTFTSLLSSLVK